MFCILTDKPGIPADYYSRFGNNATVCFTACTNSKLFQEPRTPPSSSRLTLFIRSECHIHICIEMLEIGLELHLLAQLWKKINKREHAVSNRARE